MQIMINVMEPGVPDRSRANQRQLYDLARQLSPWEETAPGASILGWIAGLESLGHGRFQEMATDSRQEALRTAARQMRLTGRPVGLWVWGGKHAWVISGFKASADPAYTDDFRVSHVWIEDPWSGRVSSIWGPGLAPHTLLTARRLGEDFLRYANRHRPQYGPEGKYTIIVPVA